MITSIARQSIIFKCTRQQSVILGNYEFYYVAGLMNHCFHIGANSEMKPLELYDYVMEAAKNVTPSDEKEKYMLQMLENYDPMEEYDIQMQELFRWGETEKDIWQIQTDTISG